MNKKCLFCNKSFVDFSVNKVKKYCNSKCLSKGRRILPISVVKKCINCDKEFIDTSYSKTKTYCNRKCFFKSKEQKQKKNKYLIGYRKKDKYINYINKLKQSGKLNEYYSKYRNSTKYIFMIKKYRKTDKFLILHKSYQAFRRAYKLKAVPKWANLEKIKDIYRQCGKGYHVDHRIPLQGTNVCGLHVENNLQILKAEDNISKGNRFIG
jgi:hypothetical protein